MILAANVEAVPVVPDAQAYVVGRNGQFDFNLPGLPVGDGIVNCFLGDPIKRQAGWGVHLQIQIPAAEPAVDLKEVLSLCRQVLQCGEQADGFNLHWVHAACKASRLADGAADEGGQQCGAVVGDG